MDASQVAEYEQRAATAEARLAALEAKAAAGGGGTAGLVAQYVSELQALKDVLLAAKAEQEALEKRAAELETENSKLRYQATHLKRALKECDEKLASKS